MEILRRILKKDPKVFEYPATQACLDSLTSFGQVVKTTFGLYLDEENYEDAIREFAFNYVLLVSAVKPVENITFNISLKAHMVRYFLSMYLFTPK